MPETVEIIDNNNDQFSEANSSKFVGRVYGYTAIGILITTFVCAILTFLFTNVFSVLENDLYINIYLGILIGSAVCLFGVSIWANMTAVFKVKIWQQDLWSCQNCIRYIFHRKCLLRFTINSIWQFCGRLKRRAQKRRCCSHMKMQ